MGIFDSFAAAGNIESMKTGDIILVTGRNSESLVKAQKIIVPSVVSSHVAIAHEELACIDANLKIGVRRRFILDVIADVKPGWRVIRKRGLSEEEADKLLAAVPYFLGQRYRIHISEKIGKSKSYCSELARKIYSRSQIEVAIPPSGLITPGHFDLLHQQSDEWEDVTGDIEKWIDFVRQNEKECRELFQVTIDGLKLNRRRYDDRDKQRKMIRSEERRGNISKETMHEMLKILDDAEEKMSYRFWDVEKRRGN